MNERIDELKKFIQEDPGEPFNYYALAMELRSQNISECQSILEQLTKQFPEYLPSYYQLASILTDSNQRSKAKEILQQGIQLAIIQNNHKTLAELRQLLSNTDDE